MQKFKNVSLQKKPYPVSGSQVVQIAQLGEHRSAERDVAASNPCGPTLRVFKQLRRKCCLCNDICNWLDFLVFLHKDEKP